VRGSSISFDLPVNISLISSPTPTRPQWGLDLQRDESSSLTRHRVYDFRNLIHGLTRVPPARQKLIGLSKGKLPPEADPLRFATLGIKKGCKFTMIGTPEELSFKDPKDVFLPEVSSVTILTSYDHAWACGVDAAECDRRCWTTLTSRMRAIPPVSRERRGGLYPPRTIHGIRGRSRKSSRPVPSLCVMFG
jgi:hypothetical protein